MDTNLECAQTHMICEKQFKILPIFREIAFHLTSSHFSRNPLAVHHTTRFSLARMTATPKRHVSLCIHVQIPTRDRHTNKLSSKFSDAKSEYEIVAFNKLIENKQVVTCQVITFFPGQKKVCAWLLDIFRNVRKI